MLARLVLAWILSLLSRLVLARCLVLLAGSLVRLTALLAAALAALVLLAALLILILLLVLIGHEELTFDCDSAILSKWCLTSA